MTALDDLREMRVPPPGTIFPFAAFEAAMQCPACGCLRNGSIEEPNVRNEACGEPLPRAPYCACHDERLGGPCPTCGQPDDGFHFGQHEATRRSFAEYRDAHPLAAYFPHEPTGRLSMGEEDPE